MHRPVRRAGCSVGSQIGDKKEEYDFATHHCPSLNWVIGMRDDHRSVTRFPVRLLLTTIVALQCPGIANVTAAENLPKRSTSSIVLAPCKLSGLAETARCGALDVPENPTKPSGRRLRIGVAVIPATGEAQADPLVPLMGGPGEETISAAAYFAEQFAPLRRDHDILLVDHRGTGRSSTLRCDLYAADDPAVSLRDLFPPAAVKRCEEQLSARADLTQYTYAHFANDLEQVRRGLGYGRMNIAGGSYGTRAAQVLMRAYPQSVRTAYLGSVVPIDVITPLTMAKSAQVAIDNTLEACAAESACNAAFPNLREEFQQVMARLDTGKVRVTIPSQSGTFPIRRGRVMEWFRSMNYRPGTAAELPWMIHRAYMGDFGPFVEGVLSNARSADAGLSFGLFFSITCSDDVAFMREEDIVRETQGTFLGDYRARQQQAACRQWPKAPHPADYRTPVRSKVPTLFVSGDLDGASPLWMTEHAAQGFSNRLEVVLGGKGHTDVTDCIPGLYEQFVRSGDTRGLDASACKPVPRPPFKTRQAPDRR
jgi:pimeloyl-ACP methyl ester carboxylesterase